MLLSYNVLCVYSEDSETKRKKENLATSNLLRVLHWNVHRIRQNAYDCESHFFTRIVYCEFKHLLYEATELRR